MIAFEPLKVATPLTTGTVTLARAAPVELTIEAPNAPPLDPGVVKASW